MYLYGRDLETDKIMRGGVIPYTVFNGKIHFLLGIDWRTRDLTDFGGGIKAAESVLEGTLRELTEETCQLFGKTTDELELLRKRLIASPVIVNSTKTAVIFILRVEPKWVEQAENKFVENQKGLKNKKYNELIGIKWIEQHTFRQIAYNRKNQCMWRRIQNIIRENSNWDSLLLTIVLGPKISSVMTESWNTFRSKREILTN